VYSAFGFANGQELMILDGRQLTRELGSLRQCRSMENALHPVCERLARLCGSMQSSLFAYDLQHGYYGADVLQTALYADWNIKKSPLPIVRDVGSFMS
jgi:hypothetical protein